MKERNIGLDVVRCVAIFLVICQHFLLYSDFYNTELNSIGMYFLSCFRWFTLICVPLFIVLTGYLNNSIKFDKAYFYKLFKVLISYVIIGVVCLIFKKVYLKQNITFINGIISLFNFSAIDYAWYVEMYIGLFLLIPFLNVLYKHLKTKEDKLKLLIVLGIIFSLTVTLRFFYPPQYNIEAFSNYWIDAYPILFFFIGKYLREYSIKVKSSKLIVLLIFLFLFHAGIIFITYHNQTYLFEKLGGYAGGNYNLFTIIETVIVFTVFSRIKFKNKVFVKAVTLVSLISFEMYLISSLFDVFIYNEMSFHFNNTFDYLINFLIAMSILLPLICISAFVINKFSRFLYIKLRILYDKVCLVLNKYFGLLWKKIIK